MKTVPMEFRHDGRTLRQLKRTATAAIYQLIGHQGLTYGFEVLKIAIKKENQCFGAVFPEHEAYPSASQFGRMAWSFGTLQKEQAFRRFDTLVQREEQTVHVYAPSVFVGHPREVEATCN
jgi:hypothetical protein